ncbi:T3SS effector HopA1 family protein [Nonomuraea sediminis]|uniref:T3SS effector HopA1 family protein n=1 Tax=Nonomuraea sediminis TaxID=2835864 RepID=UPI001BDC120F|nr:T3SS effector HopA1 family protein [Nonomuraea sediminis]
MSTTGTAQKSQRKRKKKTTRNKVKKQATTPTQGSTGPTPVPVAKTKTKRSKGPDISVDVGRSLDTPKDRYDADVEANASALDKIYDRFYEANGQQRLEPKLRKRLYSFMGKGTTDYLKAPIALKDFQTFVAKGKQLYRVTSQALRSSGSTDPKAVEAKLADGDYFRVYNDTYPGTKADLPGKARRIIVNVKTQEAALRVSEALTTLYGDKDVGPYVRQFKVYLSGKQGNTDKVKYDKLVVYYRTDDTPDSSDKVGDAIAATIEKAAKPSDRETAFAPFYSRVAPGIAWSEEPKYYVSTLKGSFTKTRRDIIADVIEKNPNVTDKAAFAKLVADAFRAAKVDADRPAQHL